MAIDPRQLKPARLVQLLNSTPLREVISERQLHRHRSRAGLRIGDGRTVNLLRYVAWLVDERHRPVPEPEGLVGYDAHRERARARSAELSLSGRDIGELPTAGNLDRKVRAAGDFRFFCEQYFAPTFSLPWSQDHLKVIAKIEQAVLQGGLFAMAMPRGSGKALALDTPLPTPDNWTTMGQVQVGDLLFDERGRQCRVVFATEVMRDRPCYAVEFSDGERIVCDADHLWTVEDRYSRRNPLTLRTAGMAPRVRVGNRADRSEHRYAIALTQPLQIMPTNLPIPPYVLGLWLGNGHTSGATVTNHAQDHQAFADQVRWSGEFLDRRPSGDRGLACAAVLTETRTPTAMPSMCSRLRQLGLLGRKHIPSLYLRASASARLALLQRLMDTNGSVQPGGRCEVTLKAGPLADGVAELLSTLGINYGVMRYGCG